MLIEKNLSYLDWYPAMDVSLSSTFRGLVRPISKKIHLFLASMANFNARVVEWRAKGEIMALMGFKGCLFLFETSTRSIAKIAIPNSKNSLNL